MKETFYTKPIHYAPVPAPPDREDLAPDDKHYSVVKFDDWKAPTDSDFWQTVTELDNLDELPISSIGRGESLVIYDVHGNTIASWEGPDHPTAQDFPTNDF